MLKSIRLSSVLVLLLAASNLSLAAERPTLNTSGDPRPDILPHPFYYAHTEYRRAYNRPRFVPGWIAAQLEPTSQEAMVWRENYQCGRYEERNMPPMCKTYYWPKPWEALQTGPRPDFAMLNAAAAEDSASQVGGDAARDRQIAELSDEMAKLSELLKQLANGSRGESQVLSGSASEAAARQEVFDSQLLPRVPATSSFSAPTREAFSNQVSASGSVRAASSARRPQPRDQTVR